MRNYVVVVMDANGGVVKVIGPVRRENAQYIAAAFTEAYAMPLEEA